MQEGQPKAIELKNYQVPPYLIDTTELHVEINEDVTLVTATLNVRKNPDAIAGVSDLVLNGAAELVNKSIAIDGQELGSNEYGRETDCLTLYSVPDTFTLRTQVEIKPQDNTALEGLYKSGDMFCTQCEAEGFRNITCVTAFASINCPLRRIIPPRFRTTTFTLLSHAFPLR